LFELVFGVVNVFRFKKANLFCGV